MVQVNHQVGPVEYNQFFLPYSVGILVAFALKDIVVNSNWQLDKLIWKRETVETVAQQIKDNDCVGLSTYIWNKNWNYTLGKRLKELNPDMIIILGGPEVAHTDEDLFVKHPWMDVVIVSEGEYTFRQLLKQNLQNLEDIPGLVFNHNGKSVATQTPIRINNLEEIPSPYLEGIFDNIIKENPDVRWASILETNRGCPYQCTFCDWGSLTYNKVKKFNLKRTFDDLEWLGKHTVAVNFADANFGIFVERDNFILDKLIEVQKKYGVIEHYTINWAKNQNREVVDMVKRLIDAIPTAAQALTVSVQHTDAEVLESIKRKNLQTNRLEEIFKICDSFNIPVLTELIVGLPGDTLEKWKNNFYHIFELGNHHGISYYHAQLLENAEMNQSQTEEYKLQGSKIYDYVANSEESDSIAEEVVIVTGTEKLQQQTMIELWAWSAVIRALHIGGLCAYTARFLRKAYQISYHEFYESFIPFLLEDKWWKEQFDQTVFYYSEWIKTGKIDVPAVYGNNFFYGWNLYMRLQVMVHHEEQIDNFYRLLHKFIKQKYDVHELNELVQFQKHTIMRYEQLDHLPIRYNSSYDFYGYLVHDTPLKRETCYLFDTLENKNITRALFYKNIHYGRKRYYGNLNVFEDSSTALTHEPQLEYS